MHAYTHARTCMPTHTNVHPKLQKSGCPVPMKSNSKKDTITVLHIPIYKSTAKINKIAVLRC